MQKDHQHPNRQRGFGHGGLRLVALKLIAEQPRHGYDLIKAVSELTSNHYRPSAGVIYPLLTGLQEEQLIEAAEVSADSRQQSFQITQLGRQTLSLYQDKVEHILYRVTQRARQPLCVTRAIENFKLSIRLRLQTQVFTEEQAKKFADILDSAVQQIEQL